MIISGVIILSHTISWNFRARATLVSKFPSAVSLEEYPGDDLFFVSIALHFVFWSCSKKKKKKRKHSQHVHLTAKRKSNNCQQKDETDDVMKSWNKP